MLEIKRLEAKVHASPETGGLCRFIYSETEYFRPHCHEYYELFMTIDGEVTHYINGDVQNLKEGSLVFIRPDDIHDYKYIVGDKYRFVNLAFTKETANAVFAFMNGLVSTDLLLNSKNPVTVTLDKKEKKRLYAKFQELNTIDIDDTNAKKQKIRMLILQILSKYFVSLGTEKNEILPPVWLERLANDMKRKENFTLGQTRMNELSGKSKEHLSRCMKKYYNMTVSEYINSVRLNYVANMLKFSNMPVLDICFESGFQNVSWFYQLFNEKYGMSPTQFRNGQI